MYHNIGHPDNLHHTYEFIYVIRGRLTAVTDGQEETVRTGKGLLIFPYQLHRLSCAEKETLYIILIVSTFYIGSFNRYVVNQLPTHCRFQISPETSRLLHCHITRIPDEEFLQMAQPKPPLIALKSCLYSFCTDFLEQAELIRKERHEDLLQQTLQYIEEHFREDLTLQDTGHALSYDYHYVSRVFNETLGINLKTLVNQYRHEMTLDLLINTNHPMADIALECGFQSIRSFNRVFIRFSGTTPTVLRQQAIRERQ